jgi:hypothetical protein
MTQNHCLILTCYETTALLDYAREGDAIVVVGIDRLGRNAAEVMTTIRDLGQRGIVLRSAWLRRQQGHMKPSGFRSYESAWRVHVEPRWRTVKVADIRFSDVQARVTDLAAELSPSMVATVYSVLARISR